MKIHSNLRLSRKVLSRVDQAVSPQTEKGSFSDMMQQQGEQASKENLKRKLRQIEVQGERLSKSMTLRELRAYKLMVRQFLEEALSGGVGLKETKGFDRRGRSRKYKLLEEIDQQLLQLADELIMHEQGKIELLNRVGEIKGLMLNLLY